MPRTRTTKKLAQRIDLNYFKRPAPLRRWKFWLSGAAPVLALVVLGWHASRGDAHVYSAGALSPAHALLNARCELCHVRMASGGFALKANDDACLRCHDGPPHHVNAAFTPSCASCHVEHRGAARLAATADAACVQCHGDLHTRAGTQATLVREAADRRISSFATQHPEIAVLRNDSVGGAANGSGDPTTIKLNHFQHMQPNLKGPNGSVNLTCDDCHRTAADPRAWPFAAAPASATSVPPSAEQTVAAAPSPSAPLASLSAAGNPPNATLGRAYMAGPTYAKACAGCHTLEFDKRFAEGVPHDRPEVVHVFLLQQFRSYIAAHPSELRELRVPDRSLPEKPLAPAYRTVAPEEWVAERMGEAETLLWRKTCVQCHTVRTTAGETLPKIAPSNVTARFMPHARFDHGAHEFLRCESCHVRALSSQASTDLLLPGIATCRACHRSESPAGGGIAAAESRCFECHTYHDQSQWKPAPGRMTLPELGLRAASFAR